MTTHDVDEIRGVLEEVTPGVLLGTTQDVEHAAWRVLNELWTPEQYAAAIIWFAGIQAQVLQRARDRLPVPGARSAMFVPVIGPDESPVEVAIAQIVSVVANKDFPMMTALVRPYAFLTHGAETSQDLMVRMIFRAHATAGSGCPDCHGTRLDVDL